MAKKKVEKKKKTMPASKTNTSIKTVDTKFTAALFDELKKIEKKMSDEDLHAWIEKHPVGKAVRKAYLSVHG